MDVRLANGAELARAQRIILDAWGDPIVVRDRDYPVGSLAHCLVAGDFEGVAAFTRDEKPVCELVAIIATTPWQGVGTALIEALRRELADGFTQIRLMTTNDNVDAL